MADPSNRDREAAHAEAEGIAKRWVPQHMTARQGLVDDITASLINARLLERDQLARVRQEEAEEERAACVERARCYSHLGAVAELIADAIAARRGPR